MPGHDHWYKEEWFGNIVPKERSYQIWDEVECAIVKLKDQVHEQVLNE